MILRQNSDQQMYWMMAFALSAIIHFAVLLSFLDIWSKVFLPISAPTLPEITINTVQLEEISDGSLEDVPNTIDPSETMTDKQHPAEKPAPERMQPISLTNISHLSPIRPDTENILAEPEQQIIIPEESKKTFEVTGTLPEMATVALTPLNITAPDQTPRTPEIIRSAPAPADPVLDQLMSKIRERLGDPCLIALPRRTNGNALQVQVVADNDRIINDFVSSVLQETELPVEHRVILIDPRQCPAINMVRENSRYPALGVSLKLNSPVVGSGGHLTGTINNIAGFYTSLLLVDDNGVVQDLRRFTNFAAGSAEFDVPVTRQGAARDTSQILMVVASRFRPETISRRAGYLAEDFFTNLHKELGKDYRIALIPFEVR